MSNPKESQWCTQGCEEVVAYLNSSEKGLSSENKFLSSMYFYDKKGEALFRDIMNVMSWNNDTVF